MERMVRIGKWTNPPSKAATAVVNKYLLCYFSTEQVWTRKEHGALTVSVRENGHNTECVEEFRFNRTMEQRFRFTELKNGRVEVELQPL